eukprot:gene103-145_t
MTTEERSEDILNLKPEEVDSDDTNMDDVIHNQMRDRLCSVPTFHLVFYILTAFSSVVRRFLQLQNVSFDDDEDIPLSARSRLSRNVSPRPVENSGMSSKIASKNKEFVSKASIAFSDIGELVDPSRKETTFNVSMEVPLTMDDDSVPLEFDDILPRDVSLFSYDIEKPSLITEITEEDKVDLNLEELDNIALAISRVPEEVMMGQKRAMDQEFLKERKSMVEMLKRKEADILWREHLARQRVDKMEQEARHRIEQEKIKMSESFFEKEASIGRDFRRAREELENRLTQQKASIREKYGDLTVTSKDISRKLEINFSHAPLPIEMRIHLMRACKDKLESGHYVLMLTQFDRLGGSPLMWSKVGLYGIGPDKPAISRTFSHEGRYYNRTLRVDDSVFALCPPKDLLKPSNVLVLELFRLADESQPMDKVVAWTAIPMCNERFGVLEGKFKLPLLRGEHSPSIQHFRRMEGAMGADLSSWLCNVYIEIRHLPRDHGEDSRHLRIKPSREVRFDFMNKKVAVGTVDEELARGHLRLDVAAADEDTTGAEVVMNPVAGRKVDKGLFRRHIAKTRNQAHVLVTTKSMEDAPIAEVPDDAHKPKGSSTIASVFRTFIMSKKLTKAAAAAKSRLKPVEDDAEAAKGKAGEEEEDEVEVLERGYSSEDEFFLHPQQKGKLAGVEAVESNRNRQWATGGLEGRTVRRWQSDGSRFDSEAIATQGVEAEELDPNKPHMIHLGSSRHQEAQMPWRHLDENDLTEMETFTTAVAEDPARRRKLLPSAIARSKLKFLWQEVFGDFMSGQRNTFEFYMNLLVFVVSFWVRIYVHFAAEYLYLQSLGTPVYDFKVAVYQFHFKYMSSSISVAQEVGAIALGPIGCLIMFTTMSLLGAAFYRYAQFFPDSASMFVAAFGIWTTLDPIAIMIVDILALNFNCTQRSTACAEDYTSNSCNCFNGDFIKLWIRMTNEEGSGVTGLLLTVIIYISVCVLSSLLLHEYVVHIHKDSRVVDLWRRIHAPVEEFFIPNDFEVSHQELQGIVNSSARWRGSNGASRKLVASEYVDRDPYDPDFEERTVHYALYEISLDGRRALYRHFLLLPDGSIIEIFDKLPIGLSSLNKYLETLFDKKKMSNDLDSSHPKTVDGAWKFGNKSLFAGLEKV